MRLVCECEATVKFKVRPSSSVYKKRGWPPPWTEVFLGANLTLGSKVYGNITGGVGIPSMPAQGIRVPGKKRWPPVPMDGPSQAVVFASEAAAHPG
jgi:hypothetical protein